MGTSAPDRCPACENETFVLVRDDFQGYGVKGNALQGYVRYENRCRVYHCQHCRHEQVNFDQLEVERLSERDKWATILDSSTLGCFLLASILCLVGWFGLALPFLVIGAVGVVGAVAWHRILDDTYKTRRIDQEHPEEETPHVGAPPV